MPIVVLHGVNTRDTDATYAKNVAMRKELLHKLVIEPLAARDARFSGLDVLSPYWGNLGVTFAWNQASVPDVSVVEHLGAEEADTRTSDLIIAVTVLELGAAPGRAGAVESLGAADGAFKRAAQKDLPRFLEAVIMPAVLSELPLDGASSDEEGLLAAQLVLAVRDVSLDIEARAAVQTASSDDAVIQALKQRVGDAFKARAGAGQPVATNTEIEGLGGGVLGSIGKAIGRVDELFDRVKDAPARAASLPILDKFRGGLHSNLSKFFGDVFVYLNDRGDVAHPGPILRFVIEQIKTAPRARPDEPLIMITHSMGGNILYDILTHFDPTLEVDVWISVGTQVAQFEEMKLFRASDKKVNATSTPATVSGLKPRVQYWLNIYDPVDIFGFMAKPVFADVDADIAYLTGAPPPQSHSAYFGRASFYDLLRQHIEKALP